MGKKHRETFWAYILENPAAKFYISQTSELEARVEQHNATGPSAGKYTLKNGPWKLVWFEQHPKPFVGDASRASDQADEIGPVDS